MKRLSCKMLSSATLVSGLLLSAGGALAAPPALSMERLIQQEEQARLPERLGMQEAFEEAYRLFPQLPEGVLEAMAFVGSRWIHRIPAGLYDGHHHMPQTWGVMGLHRGAGGFRNVVQEAAQAAGLSEEEVIRSPRANILATAALLEDYRREAGLEGPLVEELGPILERVSGLPLDGDVNAYARLSYVFDILLTLDRGHDDHGIRIDDREVLWDLAFDEETLDLLRAPLVRVAVEQDLVDVPGRGLWSGRSVSNDPAARTETASTDYPPALWVTSPNYSSRNGSAITHVAIHTVQGSYSGCISWFQNSSSDVSAHYVMRSSDGQVTQMVREYNKAWHIGSENPYTLGTEHEGYVDTSSYYTSAMYSSSAKLTKDMCTSNKFDCSTTYAGASSSSVQVLSSSYHVKGHQHYPNQTHTDPGKYWDWPRYKSLITGSTTTPPTTTTTVLDSFESSEGHFATSPTYSGSTVGISTSSTAERVSSAAKNGSYSEQIKLLDNGSSASAWEVRFLSGTGDPAQNTKLTKAGGKLGFWVYSGGSGMYAALGMDDSDGTERSVKKAIPVNTWTYLEWSLDDAAQWDAWYNGNGQLDSSSPSLDAIWLFRDQTSYTVYVYLDDVTFKK